MITITIHHYLSTIILWVHLAISLPVGFYESFYEGSSLHGSGEVSPTLQMEAAAVEE